MEPQPYFSIVIPTLNEEKFLPNLLSDLARQTHTDFEVIIVDGRSEDRTRERAALFQNKLPSLVIIESTKRNVSYQRNLGAKKSSGKYLLFIDADSRLPIYFLSGLVYRIMSDPSDIFTCWCDPDGKSATDKAIANIINISVETSLLLDLPAAIGALIGCHREVFAKTIGFNPKVPFAEDIEFVKRVAQSGSRFKIYRDPKFIMSLRRFKKNGTLKQFQNYALLHFKRLIEADINQKKEYPMGGKVFTSDKSTQNFIDKIIKTLDAGTKSKKIVNKIKALIELDKLD